ncbi:MAG: hypothetical protein ACU0BJ_16260 [Shimia sp.]
MTPDSFMELAGQIDDVTFIIAAAILLIELAEAWFKGSLKGKTLLEMIASASTQIPYLLVEVVLMTGAYAALYVVSFEFVPWSIPTTWPWLLVALLLADFTYYWEHRIAH